MLKVLNSIIPKISNLEIDFGSISYSCQDDLYPIPIYWRTGDFKRLIIEMGINPETGELSNVGIPGFDAIRLESASWETGNLPVIRGVPICKIDSWSNFDNDFSNRFIDEPMDVEAVIGSDFVSFAFTENVELAAIYQMGRLSLAVDKSMDICKMVFHDLTEDEMTTVLATARIKPS